MASNEIPLNDARLNQLDGLVTAVYAQVGQTGTTVDGSIASALYVMASIVRQLYERTRENKHVCLDKISEPTTVAAGTRALSDPSGFPYSTDPAYEFGPIESTTRPTLDDLNKENGREFTTEVPAPEIEVSDFWVNQWLKARGVRFNTPIVLVFRDPKIKITTFDRNPDATEKKRRNW
jgi:hypothetical protein